MERMRREFPQPSQNMIPVLVTSILAFTVVFAKPEDLATRLSTLVTLFLALVAVQFVIADQLPRTSYMISFTVLVLISYSLISILILESLFVFYLSALEENHKRLAQRVDSLATQPLSSSDPANDAAAEPENGGVSEGAPAVHSDSPLMASGHSGVRAKVKQTTKRYLYRPFMYTEAKLMATLGGKDNAFRVAVLIDNISLILLGIGFVLACILVFTIVPSSAPSCST